MKGTGKIIRVALITAVFAVACDPMSEQGQPEHTPEVIYPKYRQWGSPSANEAAKYNPPSFQWPSDHREHHDFRLAKDRSFTGKVIERKNIPYAVFNPHQKLDEGLWYWQYKRENQEWSPVDSFRITSHSIERVIPPVKTIIDNVPDTHPRLLVHKHDLEALRSRAANYPESKLITEEADEYLLLEVPAESDAVSDGEGQNDFQEKKLANLASKDLGRNVGKVLTSFSEAYILSGDPKYIVAAKKWMIEVSGWDPKGVTHKNNFGDSYIMVSLATCVDTFWEFLSPDERKQILAQVSARANQFYHNDRSYQETKVATMHFWQRIIKRLIETSIAVLGEVPEAEDWLEYYYEVWANQSPKMGEDDGAWFNGSGYYALNTLSLIRVPMLLEKYSGVNFFHDEWYHNNLDWINYTFPPGSVQDGFGNDGSKNYFPSVAYAGYADAFARITGNPNGVWYRNKILEYLGKPISADKEHRWFRVSEGYEMELPEAPKRLQLEQAARFPDVGVAYMNSSLENIENNLMLSVKSSPFGPLGHTHAEQNGFNIAYGGKKLFYNTGYRGSMGDPHTLAWFKHTRGHNAVLIDDNGQPYDGGAYGTIPRFLHGDQLSYAVADASKAYSGVYIEKVDYGLTRFKRHIAMLRPGLIVIYDDLEADHPAEWSWLIHNDDSLVIDASSKTIVGENAVAGGQVSLYSSTPIDFKVFDQFTVEPKNFTGKKDQLGNLRDFVNQWHFSGISKEKTNQMRYLALIQVNPEKKYHEVVQEREGVYKVGDWKISAEMDAGQPALLKVEKSDQSAFLVSSGSLNMDGDVYHGSVIESAKLVEVIAGERISKEAVDEIPSAVKRAALRK